MVILQGEGVVVTVRVVNWEDISSCTTTDSNSHDGGGGEIFAKFGNTNLCKLVMIHTFADTCHRKFGSVCTSLYDFGCCFIPTTFNWVYHLHLDAISKKIQFF